MFQSYYPRPEDVLEQIFDSTAWHCLNTGNICNEHMPNGAPHSLTQETSFIS